MPTAPSTPTPTEARITLTDPVTRIAVEVRSGRHTVRTTAGQLRAQRVHGPSDRVRLALVGQTALLLGGDRVVVDVEVGQGAWLELSDIAGTVAYHGRGRAASWHTSIRLGEGARLDYAGLPLVVSDGADVTRTLTVDLADDATVRLRETLVLGRAGETGGRLDSHTLVRHSGAEICREELVAVAGVRDRPGVLAGVRVIDSVFCLGAVPREVGGAPGEAVEACRTYFSARDDVVAYTLVDGTSTITRFLGTSLAESPLR